jgi:hypothetical protein
LLIILSRSTPRRVHMLSDKDAVATVAVKNLETAKQFYEGTLGRT